MQIENRKVKNGEYMAEDKSLTIAENIEIRRMIYTIRNKQVMLDSDLAALYSVETKYLNRQRSRNANRFPEDFCFRLTKDEYEFLRCQKVTSKPEFGSGGRRYMPYVFTEQGIAMLSSVLKSDIAAQVSIKIMRAFVEMRRFLVNNKELFSRLDRVELKQIETDKKLEEVFDCLASQKEVKQKIFYDGQIYDAFSFLVDLIKKATTSIVLIDNYVDTDTLNILCKKNDRVDVKILGSGRGSLSNQDIQKFNAQYPNLTVRITNDFHDRFIIIDEKEVYHIGASLKDAGKKSFGATKIEEKDLANSLLSRI